MLLGFIRSCGARVRHFRTNLSELLAVRFFLALIQKIGQDEVFNNAAGIAYYAVLSLFPLLLSLIAILGLFLPSESVQQGLINFFAQYLPGSLNTLQDNIPDIIRFRSAIGIAGIVTLVWSATGVFSASARSINRAWDIQYKHPFYIKKPLEIAMVLGTGILFLFSLGASTFLSFLGGLSLPISGIIVNVGTAVIAFVFSLIIFLILHKLSLVVSVSWRHIWPGAVLSTLLFEIAKTLFVFYLNHFNHYDKIYGSIASAIVLLVWIYVSAFILLLGAEFSSMLFRLKREGDTFDKSDNVDIMKEF
jgi:membrane protein